MTATGYAWGRPVPRTASVARRAVAFAVDSAIVFGLAWVLTFVLAAIGVLRIPDISVFGVRNGAAGLLWIVSIFELPLLLAYFTVLEGTTGRTPGKMLAGLRVARVGGARVSMFESFVRNLLRLLWVTPVGPIFFIIDAYALRRSELDQRLGDLAVDAVVLDERAAA